MYTNQNSAQRKHGYSLERRNQYATGTKNDGMERWGEYLMHFLSRTVQNPRPYFLQVQFFCGNLRTLTQKMLGADYTTAWDGLIELLLDESRENTSKFLLQYVFQATVD